MRLLALGYRFVWLAMVVALAAIGVPCAAIANEPLPPQTGAAAPQTPGAAPAAVQDTPWQPNSIVYDSPYLGWGHFNPQIAVDSAGNAYAAWEDCRLVGHGCDIYFAYRPASAGWQANERIDDDTTAAHQSAPSIAVDAAGNAYAAWQDDRDGNPDIRFAYRPAGGSWSASAKVNDDTGATAQSSPAIAVTAAGDASLVWQDDRDGDADIYFAYRPAGGSWSGNVKVNDDAGTASQTYPAIAVDPSGNAYAVWADGRNGADYPDIYSAYRPAGGAWETSVRINAGLGSSTTTAASHPDIAAIVDGSATLHVVAAWASNGLGSWNLYSADRATDGSWGNEVPINDHAGAVKAWASAESYVDLALDTAGSAYAVWADWRDGNSNKPDVYSAHRAAGSGGWDANQRVNDVVRKAWGSSTIAVTSGGDAWAIWMDDRNDTTGLYHEIFSAQRPVGGSWGADDRVNDDPGYVSQALPAIAVDGSGNSYAIWVDDRNANYPNEYDRDIYFAYRPAGGSWGANVQVNDDSNPVRADQTSPAIAVDSSGNAYAIWVDYRNDWLGDSYFAYRPAGGDWGANVQINDDVENTEQYSPAIALDAAGNASAVWQDNRNGDMDIYYAYRPAGGSWSSNERVNKDTGTAAQSSPAIALDAAGNTAVVWQDERNVNSDIYFAYRPSTGVWTGEQLVNDDGTTAKQFSPAISTDTEGNTYVTWQDNRNVNSDIYFAYRPAAGAWSANERINDDVGSGAQYGPAIAIATSGTAYAVWHDYREPANGADIYGTTQPNGGSWEANNRVNDDVGSAGQYSARVTVDTAGSAYAIWVDERDSAPHIYFSFWLNSNLGPPGPVSNLQISRLDTDVRLDWTHDGSGVNHYEVWRSSTNPYFNPTDPGASKIADVPADVLTCVDAGAWAEVGVNYYYLVQAVNGSGQASDVTERVGKFALTIVPGA